MIGFILHKCEMPVRPTLPCYDKSAGLNKNLILDRISFSDVTKQYMNVQAYQSISFHEFRYFLVI